MKNLAYILELIWLSLAVICLGIGSYSLFSSKAESNYIFFVLSVIAFLMYLLRRNRRLKNLK